MGTHFFLLFCTTPSSLFMCRGAYTLCEHLKERGWGAGCGVVTSTAYHAHLFFCSFNQVKCVISKWHIPPPSSPQHHQYRLESFESFWKISCNFWIFYETFQYFVKLFWIVTETFCILDIPRTFEHLLERLNIFCNCLQKLFEYFRILGEYFLKLFKHFLEPLGTFWMLPGYFLEQYFLDPWTYFLEPSTGT